MDQKADLRFDHQKGPSIKNIMQEINTETDLNFAIYQLERKQAEEGQLLKEHFFLAYERMKPANLFRNTISDVASSPFLIENIIGTVIGLGTGYLSRKIMVGASGNIFKKLFGLILQFGITNVVAQHPDRIKSIAGFIFKHIMHRKELNHKNIDR
jgi:hypothetical protein